MSQPRRAKKIDKSQIGIVGTLRGYPGISVKLDVDDILVGYNMQNYLFEIKNPDAISKKTGLLLESKKTKSQKRLDRTWTGHRGYATCVKDILQAIGYRRKT